MIWLRRFMLLVLLGAPVWTAAQEAAGPKPAATKSTATKAAKSDKEKDKEAGKNKEEAKKDVLITGGLSSSEAAAGDSVLYWVTVENHSTSPLENLSVQLEVAKDEFAPTCRLPGATADSPGCGSLKVDVQPNQAISIQGELRTLDGTEGRNINAIVTFDVRAEAGGVVLSSTRALTLGPLIVRSWQKRWYDNLKELLLPIVLAVFGYLLTRGQEDRAQVAQTWNNMLPISHKMATQYYTPMLAAAKRVFLDEQKFTNPVDPNTNLPDNDAVSLYFHLLLMWRRFDRTLEEKGAIYFKSRMGETLVLYAIAEFRKAYKGETSQRAGLTAALKNQISLDREKRVKAIFRKMPHQMDLAQFRAIWDLPQGSWRAATQAYHDGWPDFCSWYTEKDVKERVLKLLNAFALILDYEMNRPYNKWYNKNEKMVVELTDQQTLESLISTGQGKEQLLEYLDRAKAGKAD